MASLNVNKYNNIYDAITAIGTDEVTLVISRSEVINAVTNIPINIDIRVEGAGEFFYVVGGSLDIAGYLDCPKNKKIFNGFLLGGVTLSNELEAVYAAWWGCHPVLPASDNLFAIQSAFASRNYGNIVRLGLGIYDIDPTTSNMIAIYKDGSFIEGVATSAHSSNASTVLHNTGTGDGLLINAYYRAGARKLQITGNINSRYGINIDGTLYPNLEDVVLGNYSASPGLGNGSHGLRISNAVYYGKFTRVLSRCNYGGGLDISGASNFNEFEACQFQGNMLDGARLTSSYGNEFDVCDFSGNGNNRPFDSTVDINSSSVAANSVITCYNTHLLVSGDTIQIKGHSGSTPDINGTHVVTVLTSTTFSIPVNVTVGGTGGIWTGVTGYGILLTGSSPACYGTIFKTINYEINGNGNTIYQNTTPVGNILYENFMGDHIFFDLVGGNMTTIDKLTGNDLSIIFGSGIDQCRAFDLPGTCTVTDNGSGGSNRWDYGAFTYKQITKSTSYVMTNSDNIEDLFVSGDITITLPPIGGKVRTIRINKTDSNATTVTIARSGSDTIEGGASSLSLKEQYDTLVLWGSVANNNWSRVTRKAATQADSTAGDVATLKTDFNALLSKLRTAGLLQT